MMWGKDFDHCSKVFNCGMVEIVDDNPSWIMVGTHGQDGCQVLIRKEANR